MTAVERIAGEPASIGGGRVLWVVTSGAHKAAGQGQREFGIVRGLAGLCVPHRAVRQIAHPKRVIGRDRRGVLEFNPGAQAVAGDLPQQAAQGAVETLVLDGAGPRQSDSRFAPWFGAATPLPNPQHCDRGRRAAEAGGRAAVAIFAIGDRHAILGDQNPAGRCQQRVAGGDVMGIDRAHGDGGDAVAHGNPGQAVGDRGQGHEARRRASAGMPDRALAGAVIKKDHVRSGQFSAAEIDGDGRAVAADAAAFGPGDHVGASVGAGRGIDDAQNGDAVA